MKTMKKNGGFTLVELIVVIAILAILAAVAIPAYSGYIEKANKAGDDQLLAALNKAFASACVMEGDDIYLVEGVQPIVLENGKVPATAGAPYVAAFQQFFGENSTSEFKIYNGFAFDKKICAFIPVDKEAIAVIQKLQTTLTGSSFAGNEGYVLNNLQSLTNVMRDAAGNMTEAQLELVMGGQFGDYLTANGVDWEDSQAVANYALLFVADQVSGDDKQSAITSAWQNYNFAQAMAANGNDAGATVLAGVDMYKQACGSTLGGMALYYANLEACVQNIQKDPNVDATTKANILKEFDNIAVEMNKVGGDVDLAIAALGTGFGKLANAASNNGQNMNSAAMQAIQNYNGTQDVGAFLGAMGDISESDLSGMTDSDNMYGSLAGIFG